MFQYGHQTIEPHSRAKLTNDSHTIIKILIFNRPFVLREIKPRIREAFSLMKSTRWINRRSEENNAKSLTISTKIRGIEFMLCS